MLKKKQSIELLYKRFFMKILKKKGLGILEVYFLFFSCMYAGFIGYKSLLSTLFS